MPAESTHRVHTTDHHVQVVRDVPGGRDRGVPIPAHHIVWTHPCSAESPDRELIEQVADEVAEAFNRTVVAS